MLPVGDVIIYHLYNVIHLKDVNSLGQHFDILIESWRFDSYKLIM